MSAKGTYTHNNKNANFFCGNLFGKFSEKIPAAMVVHCGFKTTPTNTDVHLSRITHSLKTKGLEYSSQWSGQLAILESNKWVEHVQLRFQEVSLQLQQTSRKFTACTAHSPC